jgi:hypothetical protein
MLLPDTSLSVRNLPSVPRPYATSSLRIIFEIGHIDILRDYLPAISALEIDGAGNHVKQDFLHGLDELMNPNFCPNITRIVLHDLYNTQLVRDWVEKRGASGHPLQEIVYEQCED